MDKEGCTHSSDDVLEDESLEREILEEMLVGAFYVRGSHDEISDIEQERDSLPEATPVRALPMGTEYVVHDAQIVIPERGNKDLVKKIFLTLFLISPLVVLFLLRGQRSFADRILQILAPVSGRKVFDDVASTQYLTWRTMSDQLSLRSNSIDYLKDPQEVIERYLSILIPVSTFQSYEWHPQGQEFEICEIYPCNDEGFISNMVIRNNNGSIYGGGILVSEVGALKGLTDLILSRNGINNTIPTEVGNLKDLSVLDLRNNNFHGTIPSEIGKLENLEWIFLDRNRLEGNIPSEFGNLKKLIHADLSSNSLSGTISLEMKKNINLEGLLLKGNNIRGSLDFLCEKDFSNEPQQYQHSSWSFAHVVEHNYSYAIESGIVVECIDEIPVADCDCCICG